MRNIVLILSSFLIFGCDCNQEVNLFVVDANTGYEINNVAIWKTSTSQHIHHTNELGFAQYKGISGGLFRCPDVQLNFEKENYKPLMQKFKPYLHDTITVILEKEFDFSKIRKEVIDSVIIIEKIGGITSGIVGYSGKTPNQWHTRQWITNNATKPELLALIDYPNIQVKAIAFEGLYRHDYVDIYIILLKIIEEYNTELYYQMGCEERVLNLGEFCFSNIMKYQLPGQPPMKPDSQTQVVLSLEQIETIIKKLGY